MVGGDSAQASLPKGLSPTGKRRECLKQSRRGAAVRSEFAMMVQRCTLSDLTCSEIYGALVGFDWTLER
ncbi:MAG TPA: hypothetical protein DCQ06_07695 [Myxococcales bacterium]|nr:hypothetical protein [Myxococcales bacterium]